MLRAPPRAFAVAAVALLCVSLVPAPSAAQAGVDLTGPGTPPAGGVRPGGVRVAVYVGSAPFASLDDGGQPVGITPDFLQLMGIRAGVDFTPVPMTSVPEFLDAVRNGKAEVIAGIAETPERDATLAFTAGYAWIKTELWAKAGARLPPDMAGRTVGIVRGGSGASLVGSAYPAARVVDVDNQTAGLLAVEHGEVDAFLGGVPSVVAALRALDLNDITPFGPTVATTVQRFAVAKENTALLATLDRALAAIPADERQAVYLKWAGADLSEPMPPPGWLSGEALTLLGAAVAVVAFFGLWASVLRRQVRHRTRELEAANVELRREAAEKAQLAAIVEDNEDAIVGLDLKGVVRTWNRGAEALLGYPAREAVGRHFADLVPTGHANIQATLNQRVAGGERVEPYETEHDLKDGSRRVVSITLTPLRDADHHVTGASLVARDVSDKKRLAELRRGQGS